MNNMAERWSLSEHYKCSSQNYVILWQLWNWIVTLQLIQYYIQVPYNNQVHTASVSHLPLPSCQSFSSKCMESLYPFKIQAHFLYLSFYPWKIIIDFLSDWTLLFSFSCLQKLILLIFIPYQNLTHQLAIKHRQCLDKYYTLLQSNLFYILMSIIKIGILFSDTVKTYWPFRNL